MRISSHSSVIVDTRLIFSFLFITFAGDVCLLHREVDAPQPRGMINTVYQPLIEMCLCVSVCACLNRPLVYFPVCMCSAPGGEADGEGEAQAAFSAQPAGA